MTNIKGINEQNFAETQPPTSEGDTTPSDNRKVMIELNDVYKVYPRKKQDNLHALDGINLKIYEGDIHGIVGQSGAGKSTLIRCLTALEKPTSGSIYVDGEDLSALAERELPKARRAIGMVFQAAHLFDSRTAAGNIAYPLYLAKQKRGTRHERVEELLALVGLSGRGSSYPSQLSGGQQQRVGIARALADNPSVLLCDEPTSALDTESTQQILHLIRDLRDRLGVTVVIITHEMSVVREICDSVTLLESGRMVQTGRVEDIIAQPETRLAQELVPPPRVDEEVQLDGKYTRVIDIAFTSTPGKPTGAKVMSVVADEGADVVGGTFETIGKTQVGRLALAVPVGRVEHAVRTFRSLGIYTEVRK